MHLVFKVTQEEVDITYEDINNQVRLGICKPHEVIHNLCTQFTLIASQTSQLVVSCYSNRSLPTTKNVIVYWWLMIIPLPGLQNNVPDGQGGPGPDGISYIVYLFINLILCQDWPASSSAHQSTECWPQPNSITTSRRKTCD